MPGYDDGSVAHGGRCQNPASTIAPERNAPPYQGEQDSIPQRRCNTSQFKTEYEDESLAGVMFVPLIGEQGWSEDGRRAASNHVPGHSRGRTLPQMIAETAEALPAFEDPAFGALFDRYAERRLASLPKQFDAFVWFDETTAVTPLGPQHAKPGVPDTYPFAL